MNGHPQLPAAVLDCAHWRINIRPADYDPSRVPSLRECRQLVERNAVHLRGWDYPHISHRAEQSGQGNTWIASWSEFTGHLEYWRFYQSGQFLHLFSVQESTDIRWREQLKRELASRAMDVSPGFDWDKVPGFLSLMNVTYTVAEIVEFTTRLAQSGVYLGAVNLTIELKGIRGFVLHAPGSRSWCTLYTASEDAIGNTWSLATEDILADTASCTVDVLRWLFERFGWFDPPTEVLHDDVVKYREGRR